MDRRNFLFQLGSVLGLGALPALACAGTQGTPLRVAGGWRMQERDYQVGILEVDFAGDQAAVVNAVTVTTLPHAVVPEAGGLPPMGPGQLKLPYGDGPEARCRSAHRPHSFSSKKRFTVI